MAYLIAAYGVVWAGTLLYLLRLSWQERALEREIRRLQAHLSAPDQAQGPEEGGGG